MALFGEKYGDEVRVLSIGADEDQPTPSTLRRHARACHRGYRLFKILSEAAVAAGIRRIEAVTQAAHSTISPSKTPACATSHCSSKPMPLSSKANHHLMNERKKLKKS